MPKMTIVRGDKHDVVDAKRDDSLLKVLQDAGFSIPAPCGGAGRCGKCLVQVRGAVSPAGSAEQQRLAGRGADSRLACCARVEGDCTVMLPKAADAVIEAAYAPWEGTLAPLYEAGFGAAFDIGTTTVAGQLFAHDERRPLAVLGQMNAQQPYGADVISRIVYCNENTVGPLQKLVRNQLAAMLEELCALAGVPTEELRRIVVTGNTTMLYILFGIEPAPLAMAPFTMDTPFGGEYDLELDGFGGVPCTVPGCVSAYVGADITCSVLASGIRESEGNILLVDAGTNGEMALSTPGGLTCCSTAAGPAFEGAGIDCGGNASAGAIDAVRFENGVLRCTTIGDTPADKLCGSGLIDAAAALLDAGLVNAKGKLDAACEGRVYLADSEVYVSQKDIRQLQLAKSAIRAGMDTLLQEVGLGYEGVDQIILCGGFGSYMNPKSAERIGLIPPGFAQKARAIGNAAGNGAGRILQSRQKWDEASAIARGMHTVELATNPYFMKRYVEAMSFGE